DVGPGTRKRRSGPRALYRAEDRDDQARPGPAGLRRVTRFIDATSPAKTLELRGAFFAACALRATQDWPVYVAKQWGVSHRSQRVMGKPCSLVKSKISRAMFSAVG